MSHTYPKKMEDGNTGNVAGLRSPNLSGRRVLQISSGRFMLRGVNVFVNDARTR